MTISPATDDQEPVVDDMVLVDLARQGDTKAYDQLVLRHSQKLHSMLIQMMGNEEDAYDVAQDAFMKAYHSLRYFNGRSAFYTWLYSIASNQGRNYLRKRKRSQTYSFQDDTFGDTQDYDSRLTDHSIDADPKRRLQIRELRKQLTDAMSKLSQKHQEVVRLYDIQGMSYSDISALLKISEGTLRSRLHYAHKQLQASLSDLLE